MIVFFAILFFNFIIYYHNFFRRVFAECIYEQHEHRINRFSRSSRERLVIGSQSHPARSVSAQQDTRRFIRRPSLLFLPHTYRKHSSSFTYLTYPIEIVSSRGCAAAAISLLTRPQIIVRANVIKRIALQSLQRGNDGGKRAYDGDVEGDRFFCRWINRKLVS